MKFWNEWHLLHQICLQAKLFFQGGIEFEPGLATVVEILSSWAPLRRKLFLWLAMYKYKGAGRPDRFATRTDRFASELGVGVTDSPVLFAIHKED